MTERYAAKPAQPSTDTGRTVENRIHNLSGIRSGEACDPYLGGAEFKSWHGH
jgi:hypothetical protein